MQKIDVGCGAFKGLIDNFRESHNLYSANGKFMKFDYSSVMSIKNSPKFMESIWETIGNNLVKGWV